jgi:hypothetical protein
MMFFFPFNTEPLFDSLLRIGEKPRVVAASYGVALRLIDLIFGFLKLWPRSPSKRLVPSGSFAQCMPALLLVI